MRFGCIELKLKIYHIIDLIDNTIEIDIVNKNGNKIYTIRQGERYGSKYYEVLDNKIWYISVNSNKMKIVVEE